MTFEISFRHVFFDCNEVTEYNRHSSFLLLLFKLLELAPAENLP